MTEQEKNGVLSDTTRAKLMGHLCEFILTTFGPYPEKKDKIIVSKATIKLFPGLEYSPDNPIVRTYSLLKFVTWKFRVFFCDRAK